MNTCDSCQWWKPETRKRPFPECSNPKLDGSKPDEWESKDVLLSSDFEFYGVYTGAKFGCIHHQPKTP